MGRYETFVIRLWAEEDGGFEHGEIRHVTSDKGLRFRRVQDAFNFIQRFAAPRQSDNSEASHPHLTPL